MVVALAQDANAASQVRRMGDDRRVLRGRELSRGTRGRTYREYLLRENLRLQLQGDDTSDGAVFSVQHLVCFFQGTQFSSHSDALGASL